jgi:ribonuclease E
MTRKRVGEGLLESFSETCKECGGSGVILTHDPVEHKRPKKSGSKKSGPSKSERDKAKSERKAATDKSEKAETTDDGPAEPAQAAAESESESAAAV